MLTFYVNIYTSQGLVEVLGKELTPVRPPQVNQLSYPSLVRDLYREQIEKFNIDEVSCEVN